MKSKRRNYWMAAASLLLCVTAAVHVFLGGPEIHHVVQATDALPIEIRAISAVLWHAVTVVLLVLATGCLWLIGHPNPPLANVMIAVQLGFAGLFVFYGMARLQTLWIMPQWIIFLLIPAVMGLGMLRQGRAHASHRYDRAFPQ